MEQSLLTPSQVKHLTWGVRGVLVFGIATSVTANAVDALLSPSAVYVDVWRPWANAALAALAPIVLFLCVELVSRIPVASKSLGVLRLLFTAGIGGVAAWLSYWHMASMAKALGQTGEAPYLYPLIIDGMMGVATISLIELGRLARKVTAVYAAVAEAEQAEAEVVEQEAQQVSRTVGRVVTPEELKARKAAGYDQMSTGEKQRWSRKWRTDQVAKAVKAAARQSSRTPNAPAAAQVSPGYPPSEDALSEDYLKQIASA